MWVPWERLPLQQIGGRIAPLFIVGAAFLAAMLFILLNRSSDNATMVVATACCFLGQNILVNTMLSFGGNISFSLAWLYHPLDLLSFVLGMSFALHTLLVFPESRRWVDRFPHFPYLLHGLNLAVALVMLSGVGFSSALDARVFAFSRIFYPVAAVEIFIGFAHLVNTYTHSRRPGVRNQIRWLMWGILIGPLPWLLFYNLPVALIGEPLLPLALVDIPLILIPIAFFFSATRRNLIAVDTLINRSLVYAGVTTLLIGVYLLSVSVLRWLLGQLIGSTDVQILSFLAIMVVALVANPLRNHLQSLVDRAFYRRQLDFKHLLHDVGDRLSTTLHLSAIVPIFVEEIPQRLQITQAALLLRQPDGSLLATGRIKLDLSVQHPLLRRFELRNAPIVLSQTQLTEKALTEGLGEDWEVILPLRSQGKLWGIYLLGALLSGELYGHEELETLILLGRQAAVTLENAHLYREIESYSRNLETLVKERTQDLEDTNKTMAQERDRLNVILQNMADGLLVTDADGIVKLVNPAFEAMSAKDHAELVGYSIEGVLDCPQIAELIFRAMHIPGEVLTVDCSAHEQILRASSTALNDQSGTITVVRNVTHEIEVDRMKTEFISTVSHELRTPLTSVLGFTKLITKSLERDVMPVLPEESKKAHKTIKRALENLQIINTEGERLTRLINDVLDIAKMEAGKVEWNDQPLDLATIITQALEGVKPAAEAKRLTLKSDLPADLPKLNADPDRIQQVILNLVSNAIKFTDSGVILLNACFVSAQEMTQKWDAAAENNGGIWVVVNDTGVGIPAEEIPNLFRRFQQVREDTLINKPKGTGLGLAICREIIVHYGGVIWAESSPGKGTRFQFVLPVPKEAATSDRPKPLITSIRKHVKERIPPTHTKPATALIVDDEPNIRWLLSQELVEAGYAVLEAANGTEAVAMARRHQPTIILLDVMMPDISGFDVTKILKSDPQTAAIPILILSIIEDREHGIALGADAYLTKPVATSLLLEEISTLITQAAQRPKAVVAGKDRSALEDITQVLREQGFEVAEAYDPRGAIVTAQKIKPDVVILDEMLSKINDAEVIKALRFQEHEQAYTIIVLASTIHNHNDDL